MDVSGIFIFFCSGGGSSRRQEGGGVRFLIENPRRGVSRRERVRGARRVSAANLGFWGGGGLNIFLGGRNVHQETLSASPMWVPKRGGLKPAGKRQESATFLQRSDFDVAVQFFVCYSAAFGTNDIRTAEKRLLQCSFCSAAFQKLQCNFRFRLRHVAGVGLRGVGFRTS